MSWHVLILFQITLVALATIVTRFLARDRSLVSAGFAITAGWYCAMYLFGLLVLPAVGGVDSSILGKYILFFVAGGIAFSLGNVLFYFALTYIDAAVVTIMGTVSVLFTIFGGSYFLHENLNNLQILGTCLLLASVAYGVLATRHQKTRSSHRKLAIGGLFVLSASIFYAIATVNEKFLLNHVSTGSYLLFGWGFQTLAAACLVLLIRPGSLNVLLRPKVLGWTIGLGLARGISGLCHIVSLIKSNNVGLITVIANLKLIVVILLAAWILRERTMMTQKITAAIGATIALGVLFWR